MKSARLAAPAQRAADEDGWSVVFQEVTKQYGARRGLEDVSFRLPRHRVVGLVGKNGSGKTTILKLIAGQLQPTRGRIWVAGEPVRGRAASRVALASDADTLYPFFTVRQTFAWGQALFADFSRDRARALADVLDLGRYWDVAVGQLSKGARVRVKLAATLAREAPLLVLDEPLAGLDPLVKDDVLQSILTAIDLERQTLILSTHEVREVEPLLDLAVLVDRGRVLAADGLDAILAANHGAGLLGWMRAALAAGEAARAAPSPARGRDW